MSYNILYGAGVDRLWDTALPPSLAGQSRLPALLSVIQQANPDILGLEEANSWDTGTPPVIQQVGEQLGMNYFLARTASRFHLGLLTKFPILETENLSSDVGKQGALRAKLLAPDGEPLTVFVVHLAPNSSDTRLCELDALIQRMEPYTAQRTILIGDLNSEPYSLEYMTLEQAGWQPVAIEKSWGIDQIWISHAVAWTSTSWFDALPVPSGISDHNPIGAEIRVYPQLMTVATPIVPSSAPFIQPPAVLSDTFSGLQISRLDTFDDPCAFSRWNSRWTTEKITNSRLEITGEPSWQSFASRYKEFSEGQGAVLRFQFAKGSEFGIQFDNTAWQTDLYRRFGISIQDEKINSVMWEGQAGMRLGDLSGNLDLVPDMWYNLLLAVGKNEDLMIEVWDPANPSRVLKRREQMGEQWTGLPWIFGIGANKGKVLIDDFAEINFDAIKQQ